MLLTRISDGAVVDVRVPDTIVLTKGTQVGDAYVVSRLNGTPQQLFQSWAYRHGYEVYDVPDDVEEATTNVKQHTKRSKKGKVFNVKQHERDVKDVLYDAYQALGDYTQLTHDQVNRFLREKDGKNPATIGEQDAVPIIKAIDEAFATTGAHEVAKKDFWVYRYVENKGVYNKLSNAKTGTVFSDKAYLSTSTDRELIYKVGQDRYNDTAILNIKVPKGTKYLRPVRRDESEIILDRKLQLKVRSKPEKIPAGGGFDSNVVIVYADITKSRVREATIPRLPIFADGALDRALAEARVRVRAQVRTSKKGKKFNVRQHERNISFTGTLKGMTDEQKKAFEDELRKYKPKEFHHGAAIGADTDADKIAKSIAGKVLKHPAGSSDGGLKLVKPTLYAKRPPLIRNHDIVDAGDLLIATPRGYKEVLRSGTWATIRYAKKQNKPIHIIYPDGSIKKINESVAPRLPIFADGALDRALAEARVRVRSHPSISKKGKKFNVRQHEREVFHGTTPEHAAKILKQGIIPKKSNFTVFDITTQTEKKIPVKKVFVTSKEDEAIYWAKKASGDDGGWSSYAVITLKAPASRLMKDPNDPLGNNGLMADRIDAKWIKSIKVYRVEKLGQPPKLMKVLKEATIPRLPIFADGALDRVLSEARVRVRAYSRRDKKTGKIENVPAHERNLHEKMAVESVITISKRVWNRKQVKIKDEFKLTWQEKGALGENIMVDYLKGKGYRDAELINHGNPNSPFDIFYDQTLVEVKTGGADNKYDAMKWSLNFGQIRGEKGKKLKKMGPKATKAFYLRSLVAILHAKEKMRAEYEERTGKTINVITAGLILNHETKSADIHFTPGIHKQIRWMSPKRYSTEYQGSVRYKMKG